MPVIKGRHNGRQILTNMFVAPPADGPQLHFMSATALIDTGAMTSLIGRHIAHELRLPPRGKIPMMTARGVEMTTQYVFRLGFPSEGLPTMPFMLDDEFSGSELLAQTGFDCIIGMDVLSRCTFSMTPDARWTLQT